MKARVGFELVLPTPYVSSTKQPLMNFSWVIKIGVPFHDYAVIMQILVPFGILFLSLLLFFLIKYFKKNSPSTSPLAE